MVTSLNKKNVLDQSSSKPKKELKKNRSVKSRFYHLIRGRVILIFSILLAIIIGMQALSLISISTLQQNLKEFAEKNLQEQMEVNNLANDILKLSNYEQAYIIHGKQEALKNYQDTKEMISNKMNDLQTVFDNRSEETELLATIHQYYLIYLNSSARILDARDQFGFQNAQRVMEQNDGENIRTYINEASERFIALLDTKNSEKIKELEQFAYYSKIGFVILSILATVLTISFGMILFRNIRKNTYKINQSILEIAQAGGDLTRRVNVKTKDEFAQIANSTNILIDSIASLVKRVSNLADHVSGSSQELMALAEENAKTIDEIANNTQEIAADSELTQSRTKVVIERMQVLDQLMRELNAEADEVEQAAQAMKQAAFNGSRSVTQSSEVMLSIEETIANT